MSKNLWAEILLIHSSRPESFCAVHWTEVHILVFRGLFKLERCALIKGISEHIVLLLHLVFSLSLNLLILLTTKLAVPKSITSPKLKKCTCLYLEEESYFSRITNVSNMRNGTPFHGCDPKSRSLRLIQLIYILIFDIVTNRFLFFFNLLYSHKGKYFWSGLRKFSLILITQK